MEGMYQEAVKKAPLILKERPYDRARRMYYHIAILQGACQNEHLRMRSVLAGGRQFSPAALSSW